MKRTISFLLLVFLLACTKNSDITNVIENTVYKGTFERTALTITVKSSVTINFTDSNFSGLTQFPYYPALGIGNYILLSDSINFNNHSPWTANFDESLILSGKYKMIIKGDSLEIRRGYNGTFYEDIYKLKKQ